MLTREIKGGKHQIKDSPQFKKLEKIKKITAFLIEKTQWIEVSIRNIPGSLLNKNPKGTTTPIFIRKVTPRLPTFTKQWFMNRIKFLVKSLPLRLLDCPR